MRCDHRATLPFFFSWFSFLQRAATGTADGKERNVWPVSSRRLWSNGRRRQPRVKPEQFYVIAHVRTPAALVEGGFITNKSDVTKLATTEYRQKIASAIGDGLHRYREASKVGKPTLTLATARPE